MGVPRTISGMRHPLDAPSIPVLEEAGRSAGLQFERIVEAVNERGTR